MGLLCPCEWQWYLEGESLKGDGRRAAVHMDDISKKLASCGLKLICSRSHVCHHDSVKGPPAVGMWTLVSKEQAVKLRDAEILQSCLILKNVNLFLKTIIFNSWGEWGDGLCSEISGDVSHRMSVLGVV